MSNIRIEKFVDKSTDGFSGRVRITFEDGGYVEKTDAGWQTRWSDGGMVVINNKEQIEGLEMLIRNSESE